MSKLIRNTLHKSFDSAKLQFKQRLNLGSLPDFYIIGAQKSGTSSLYDCLGQHPGIIRRIHKEIHFFNEPTRRNLGLDFYQAHFTTQSKRQKIAQQLGYQPLEGEATPFVIHPWLPQWVYEATPQAKLILIARNPVDRALSHYYHNQTRGRETLEFEAAINSEQTRINQDFQRLVRDPNHSGAEYLCYSYLTRGYYAEQLERWLKFFAPDQICVVAFESFIQDQKTIVAQIFQFLNLPEFTITTTHRSNPGRYEKKLDPKFRQRLLDHFQPHNERFFDMIAQKFTWDQ